MRAECRWHASARRIGFVSLLVLVLTAPLCRADPPEATWVGGTGEWTDPAGWSPEGVPAPGSTVYIDSRRPVDSDVRLTVDTSVHNLTISTGDRLRLADRAELIIEGASVQNAGTLALEAAAYVTALDFAQDTSLSGGGTVTLSNYVANLLRGTGANRLTTDNVIRGSGVVGADSLAVTNRGTILANQANALYVDPAAAPADGAAGFINEGVLRAEGAVLHLYAGTYDNAAGRIEAGPAGIVDLYDGTAVTGGVLATEGSGAVRGVSNGSPGATLTDVTNTGLFQLPNNCRMNVAGTLTNTGTFEMQAAGGGTIVTFLGPTVHLTGGGELLLSDNIKNTFWGVSKNRLVNEDNLIAGAGDLGGRSLAVTNRGTIRAQGATPLNLNPCVNPADGLASFINEGLLEAAAGGTLRLHTGTYDNTLGVIDAAPGGTVELNTNARVVGGVVGGPGAYTCTGTDENPATFEDLTFEGTVTIGQTRCLRLRGTVVNEGAIHLGHTGEVAYLQVAGDMVLTGGGEVVSSDSSDHRIKAAGTAHLIIEDHLVRLTGHLGEGSLRVTNRGRIETHGTTALTIRAGGAGFLNDVGGELVADGTGEIRVPDGRFENHGLVETHPGSRLRISTGADFLNFDPATATLAGGTWRFLAGSEGGGLVLEGRHIVTNASDVTLAGLACLTGAFCALAENPGALRLEDGMVFETQGDLASPGTLQVDATSGLDVSGTLTLGPDAVLAATLGPDAPLGGPVVAAAAALGGTLALDLADGFLPALASEMPIVACAAWTGRFHTVTGVAVTPDLSLAIHYHEGGASVVAATPGDADLDGEVDVGDYFVLATYWFDEGKTWVEGDFTGDGVVGTADYFALVSHLGRQPPEPTFLAAPEPATLALLAAGLAALATRRRAP